MGSDDKKILAARLLAAMRAGEEMPPLTEEKKAYLLAEAEKRKGKCMNEKEKMQGLKEAWEQKCQEELQDVQLTREKFDEIIQEAEAYKALPWWKKLFKRGRK